MYNNIIKEAKIWDVDLTDRFPGHNMSIIELIDNQGHSGIGEIAIAYGYGAKAAQALAEEIIKKQVTGRSIFDTQAIWLDIERYSYWAEGRNMMHRGVQSAVDIALWDLKAQILGVPIYQLLGGKVRDEVPLYANHWYGEHHTPEGYAKAALKVKQDGYVGLKFDPFRMSPEGVFCIPPRPLPKDWGELACERVKAVREAVGGDIKIMLDLHASLSTYDAIHWGKRLQQYDIFFYEEPVVCYNPHESLEVKNKLHMMLAGGERLYCKQDFFPFIQERCFDVIQPDIGLAGGFTGMKEIATLAASKDIMVQPHNCASPVCSAASIHFDFSITNLLIQEWFPYWEDDRYGYFHHSFEKHAHKGACRPPEQVGLGVQINQEKFKEFSYRHVC